MPPSTVRDTTELLDVNVDDVPRGSRFEPDRLRLPNRQPGVAVQVRQPRHSIAGQHATDRRGVEPQMPRDPTRIPAASESQRDDPSLRAPTEASGRVTGSRAAVGHWLACSISIGPLLRCRRRALKPLPDSSNSPPVDDDGASDTQTPFRRQIGISVNHEDLRSRCELSDTHIVPEVFATSHVHNVPGRYT